MATYAELRGLFTDNELKNRTEVACLVAAVVIFAEDGGTDNHANRIIWAKATYAYPAGAAILMLRHLLATNRDAEVVTVTEVEDVDLQLLVDDAVDLFADGS